jgi:hypothetical protein
MPTSSIIKDFVVKDYDAYIRLWKDIRKCEECDYSATCNIMEEDCQKLNIERGLECPKTKKEIKA